MASNIPKRKFQRHLQRQYSAAIADKSRVEKVHPRSAQKHDSRNARRSFVSPMQTIPRTFESPVSKFSLRLKLQKGK